MGAGQAILAGLVLGLSSGSQCFWSCAAVMAPYLVATEADPGPRRWSTLPATARALLWYNLGRLIAYLATGLGVGLLARAGGALPAPVRAGALLGTALILGLSLLRPSREKRCWGARPRAAGALGVGLLQGLAPCPPFIAAVGMVLASPGLGSSLLLFFALFLGTALYTIPLAFLEPLRRRRWLAIAVRVVGAIVCAYLVVQAGLVLRGA